MYNAIIDDEHLNPTGIYKERLSQSALVAEMRLVDRRGGARRLQLARRARAWSSASGSDGATELTEDQVLDQLRLYIAAVRIADQFGCDAIGIQYQQGLKDMAPASDLAEGLLNDADRPPVCASETARSCIAGRPVPHFNEVDEGSAVDALVTNRVWTALGLDPATTLHDVRWGAPYGDDFVWVFEISGAVPPAHLVGGYAGAVSERQPPVYFGLGRRHDQGRQPAGRDRLEPRLPHGRPAPRGPRARHGRGAAARRRPSAAGRRRRPQWPIMHAVLHGVTRDQMMARHRANHIQVAYGDDAAARGRGARREGRDVRRDGHRASTSAATCGRLNVGERAPPRHRRRHRELEGRPAPPGRLRRRRGARRARRWTCRGRAGPSRMPTRCGGRTCARSRGGSSPRCRPATGSPASAVSAIGPTLLPARRGWAAASARDPVRRRHASDRADRGARGAPRRRRSRRRGPGWTSPARPSGRRSPGSPSTSRRSTRARAGS